MSNGHNLEHIASEIGKLVCQEEEYGLRLNHEKRKTLINGKALMIAVILFSDWYSLRELSKKFNPKMSNDKRNERLVNYYFYKFKKYEWLDENIISKTKKRKSKLGKEHKIISKCKRYRLNFEPYIFKYFEEDFQREAVSKNIRKKLIPFLDKSRNKIVKEIQDNLNLMQDSRLVYLSFLHTINKEVLRNYKGYTKLMLSK